MTTQHDTRGFVLDVFPLYLDILSLFLCNCSDGLGYGARVGWCYVGFYLFEHMTIYRTIFFSSFSIHPALKFI